MAKWAPLRCAALFFVSQGDEEVGECDNPIRLRQTSFRQPPPHAHAPPFSANDACLDMTSSSILPSLPFAETRSSPRRPERQPACRMHVRMETHPAIRRRSHDRTPTQAASRTWPVPRARVPMLVTLARAERRPDDAFGSARAIDGASGCLAVPPLARWRIRPSTAHANQPTLPFLFNSDTRLLPFGPLLASSVSRLASTPVSSRRQPSVPGRASGPSAVAALITESRARIAIAPMSSLQGRFAQPHAGRSSSC